MMKYGEEYSIVQQILTEENRHYLEKFHSGNPNIDYYFQYEAAADGTSVTYLFIDEDADRLMTCVTINCSAIFHESAFPEERQYSTLLSAMEVKYLATDVQYQHIPYSRAPESPSLTSCLFSYMLSFMTELSHTHIGASVIVLYAVPQAVNFYARHGFMEFGDTMYGDQGYYLDGCKPMFFNMN